MPFEAHGVPYGHSTNLVGVPAGLIASSAFNDYPVPLSIRGVRETSRALFVMLDQARDAAEAAEAFEKYLRAVFATDGVTRPARDGRRCTGTCECRENQDDAQGCASAAEGRMPRAATGSGRRFRASYRQLLEGWGYDANGAAGAVLKGWVESRFGLLPVFHQAPLRRVGSEAWVRYVEDKMSPRYHNNSINLQLDLLYEFCQWARVRFHGGVRHLTLYRGVNDFAEHEILARPDRHSALVRMNNLVSFSADRAVADAFGDTLLEARVPVAKLLFFRELLPSHPLNGESEYLVIGGDYRVRLSYL